MIAPSRSTIVICLALSAGAGPLVPARAQTAAASDRAQVQARLDRGDYDGAESAARTWVESVRRRGEPTSADLADALDLLTQALVLNGRATEPHTAALARQALTLRQAQHAGSDAGALPVLTTLGEIAAAAADFTAAIAWEERALRAAEGAAGPDAPGPALALDRLGAVLGLAERFDRAEAMLERSLRVKTAAQAPDGDVATTLEELGLVLHAKGSYPRAGEVLRRALALRRGLDPDHPALVRTLNLMAEQAWFEGNLLASRDASEEAVALARRVLRPGHPTLAFSLRSLGATLADLGELDRALDLKQQALAIAERSYGAAHHATAPYLHSLGLSELDRGDYLLAQRHFRRVLAIYTARYGPRHQLVATAYTVLALAEARLGDYETAVRHQAEAVRVHELVGGRTHPFVAVALTELASLRLEQGLPLEARPLLERALAIREARVGATHRDVAVTLADLAVALTRSGLRQRAEGLAERAVGIWERLDTPDAPEFAAVLMIAADLRATRGDSPGAAIYYQHALTIRAHVFGAAHPLYAEALAGLARTRLALGEPQRALDAAASSEGIGRDHLRLMLRSLPERQALAYAGTRPRGLDLMLQVAETSADAAAPALDALVRSRALVLDEMAGRLRGARAAGGDASAALATYVTAQQRLANLLVRGRGVQAVDEYDRVLEDTRRDAESAEQALAEASQEFRRRRTRAAVGLDEVRAALPPATALVSYVRYGRGSGPVAGPRRASDAYAALVLREGQPVTLVPLGAAATLEQRVAAWRRDLADPQLASERQTRVSGAAVRQALWDPIAPAIAGATQVLVVPDGVLSLVPLAALPVGARDYLAGEGPVIHYLSAERDVTVTAGDRPERHGLLVLGGPAFDAPASPRAAAVARRGSDDPCVNLAATVFTPLTGTLREVAALRALWTGSVADGAPDVLVGAQASEGAFKARAASYRVLHLATHGFFAGRTCAPRAAATRGVGGVTPAQPRQRDRPLALSGLALAGANRRAQTSASQDDGILTAEEVATLELDGVEWAVLSACDTGVGGVQVGEGVFGLRRAFQVAGARTVILSLWSVDDRATVRWMQALYQARFGAGRSTAEAMREASTQMLRERRARGQSTHPFYWAPFVAAGDWR